MNKRKIGVSVILVILGLTLTIGMCFNGNLTLTPTPQPEDEYANLAIKFYEDYTFIGVTAKPNVSFYITDVEINNTILWTGDWNVHSYNNSGSSLTVTIFYYKLTENSTLYRNYTRTEWNVN